MGAWTLRLVLAALVVLTPAAARPAAAEGISIRLAGQPLELVGTPDSLWVLTCVRRCSGEARRSTGRIVRIDPRDGRVLASVPLSRPHAIAVGSSGVYALDFWRDTVLRLDPQTLRTTASLRLVLPYEIAPGDEAFLPFDIAVGRNAVWVSTARGALARVDLRVRRVAAMLRLHVKGGEIAVGDGAVWLAQGLAGVYRVDPRTNRVSARIRIGPATGRFAVDRPLMGGGKVLAIGSWTQGDALTGRRGLARIDPSRNRLEAVTPLASGPLAVAFGKGSLWSARVGGSSVERIEARAGKVVGRFRADDVSALAVAGGHVWTATRDGTIRRLAAP
jgi:streptogramin lyase